MKWFSMIAFILATAASGFGESRLILTVDGYGMARFGMQLETLEQKLKGKGAAMTGEWECDFISFSKYPGVSFMVIKGIVSRADVASIRVQNSFGIPVGDSLDKVKHRYPNAVITPHKYDYAGHYLIFKSKDGKRAMVYEERNGKITTYRAGLEPFVEYVDVIFQEH